jgi:hypothetical protein
MKENVGTADQILRLIAGPALMAVGLTLLGGRAGRLRGLAAIVAGTLTLESGITRVCPVNSALGIDTRRRKLRLPWR